MVLCAPTGKAARNLEKRTGLSARTVQDVYKRQDIEGTKSRVGGISRNWNAESTRKANKNNYEKVIFPRIPNIPLEEMTKDDFDEIIQSIIRAGGRGGRAYSAPRIQAFKRLLKGVTEEAAKQGICEDVLFGSSYAIPESEPHTKSLEKELVRLRKSFTVKEEFLISQHVLRDAAQSGQHMGFALMFCLGPVSYTHLAKLYNIND